MTYRALPDASAMMVIMRLQGLLTACVLPVSAAVSKEQREASLTSEDLINSRSVAVEAGDAWRARGIAA